MKKMLPIAICLLTAFSIQAFAQFVVEVKNLRGEKVVSNTEWASREEAQNWVDKHSSEGTWGKKDYFPIIKDITAERQIAETKKQAAIEKVKGCTKATMSSNAKTAECFEAMKEALNL
jgi:hypothetical protein